MRAKHRPTPKLRTQDSGLRTQDSGLRTQDNLQRLRRPLPVEVQRGLAMPRHDLTHLLLHVCSRRRYRHDRLAALELLSLPFVLGQIVAHTEKDPVDLAAKAALFRRVLQSVCLLWSD